MGKHFSGILKKLKSIKHIEVILAILFALIILLVYFSSISTSKDNKSTSSTTATTYASEVENRLETLISQIDGAGKVSVMVMCETESNADVEPKIVSAVVVSSGANNVYVKLDIIKAVQALLNLNSANIEVLTGSG